MLYPCYSPLGTAELILPHREVVLWYISSQQRILRFSFLASLPMVPEILHTK